MKANIKNDKKYKKGEGNIEESQLIPRRKEFEEETDQQIGSKANSLSADQSLNLAQNTITKFILLFKVHSTKDKLLQ